MTMNNKAVCYLDKIIRNLSGEKKKSAIQAKIILENTNIEELSNKRKIMLILNKEIPNELNKDDVAKIILVIYNEINRDKNYSDKVRKKFIQEKIRKKFKGDKK